MAQDSFERIAFFAAAGAVAFVAVLGFGKFAAKAPSRSSERGVVPGAALTDLAFGNEPCVKGSFCSVFRPVPFQMSQGSMLADGAAVAWIGTHAQAVLLVTATERLELVTLPEGAPLYAVAGAKADDFWIGTKGGGVFHYDGITFAPLQLDADEPVSDLTRMESGDLLAVAGDKVFQIHGKVATNLSAGLPAQELTTYREMTVEGRYQKAGKFGYRVFADKSGPVYAVVATDTSMYSARVFRKGEHEWKDLEVVWPVGDGGTPTPFALSAKYGRFPSGSATKLPAVSFAEKSGELVFASESGHPEVRVGKDGRARFATIDGADGGERARSRAAADVTFTALDGSCSVDKSGTVWRSTDDGQERVADTPYVDDDAGAEGSPILLARCSADSAMLLTARRMWHLHGGQWHTTRTDSFESVRAVRGLADKKPWFLLQGQVATLNETHDLVTQRSEGRYEPIPGTPAFSGFMRGVGNTAHRLDGPSPIKFDPPMYGVTPLRAEASNIVWWATTDWNETDTPDVILATDAQGKEVARVPVRGHVSRLLAFPGPVLFASLTSTGLSRYENGTWTPAGVDPSGSSLGLIGSSKDDVWSFDYSFVHHFDGAKWTTASMLKAETSSAIQDLWPTSAGHALILTNRGLYDVDATKDAPVQVMDLGEPHYPPDYASVWSDGTTDWAAGPGGILRRER